MKSIKISVDQLGKTTIDAVGFEGFECFDATKPYEDKFGGEKDVNMKPEAQISDLEEEQTDHLTNG